MTHNVFLALGSNIGDREAYLNEAIHALHGHAAIAVVRMSSIYETAPVGYTDQEPFLNQVVEVQTTLSPDSLLQATQTIECSLGRKRMIRFGPRTIDLDILLFNRENIEKEQLQIPHPRMWERLFVLMPLAELVPDLYVESRGQTVRALCEAFSEREGISLWRPAIEIEVAMCLKK
ncbi:2-amino-4-hydroxy-6-hydroxymethyldihydropteridine diphosphokinase [Shouchella lonarensis]|uniref:2-amino-4-hydroxy-6-hydroxymethyldihydropteridine diphosphokinase n=1 Tax=Shouchella lonarensis TaxID=1464122 RepID=A0A1G6NTZ2_9BACI|nr:2-amino-4-hydroxy-6-hydroxymethyldihydropteridine diphosphokinase [Shouchella lonarensis]SDC71480.1 2-amino-4-hydroxy-6-hydroxymethyldihydropteridinediphosphokinase [Shouchella lonarensis]